METSDGSRGWPDGENSRAVSLNEEGSRPSSLFIEENDWEGLDTGSVTESEYDEGEPKLEFSVDMIADGLSHLGATAAGERPAFLCLELRNTSLANPAPISHCVHLQEVVLADNSLTTLRQLGKLRDLTILDASNNKLTQVLDLDLNPCCSSNLREADLSYNHISTIADLARFSRLVLLRLDENDIEYLAGLGSLKMLQHLSLCGNLLTSCKGLEGLAHLRELNLDDNQLLSLAPLSALPSLEVLSAAQNRLQTLAGLGALTGLRSLDVRCNALGALEEFAAVRGAALLGELALAGNPMEKALNMRLHVVHLLPQLSFLDGSEITSAEKVDAANMHGADAGGLLAIRRTFFPDGELDDGGGAIPPTAAGLTASHAEEEGAAGGEAAVFGPVATWVAGVGTEGLLGEGGLAAVAPKLMAGCAKEAPLKQLQAAYAVYAWVVAHVAAPRSGADSWSVDQGLFGAEGGELEEAVLPSPNGTWAEKVALLFVGLARHCQLEAVQLNGFYKGAGGALQPGGRLSTHNHSWVAVKVNGRWRLLDPAMAVLRQGSRGAPFFTPPDAFVYSHLPFEGYWQLLPEPLSPEEWWELPEVGVPFFAAGMQLMEPALRAVNVLPAPLEGRPLPTIRLPIAIPEQQQHNRSLRLQLMDPSTSAAVATWTPPGPTQHAGSTPSSHTAPDTWPLVYQQPVAGPSGQTETEFGAETHACRLHELWAALPASGEWLLQVVMETVTPGLMKLVVQGLEAPLELLLHESEVVLRCKVVVPPARPRSAGDQPALTPETPPSALPKPTPAGNAAGVQLLQPPPCKRLEADRPELIEAECPNAKAMAVGCDQHGWTELSSAPGRPGHFAGLVVLPRAPVCWLRALLPAPAAVVDATGAASEAAATADGAETAEAACTGVRGANAVPPPPPATPFASSAAPSTPSHHGAAGRSHGPLREEQGWVWQDLLAAKVEPQLQHIVMAPEPKPLYCDGFGFDPSHPSMTRARQLLEALDVNNDGLVTRKEMLLAFRRNRQLADFLKMPPRIKVADGTFDRFLAAFVAINKDGLGYIDLAQLAAHLGISSAQTRQGSLASRGSVHSAASEGRSSLRPGSGASQYSRVSAMRSVDGSRTDRRRTGKQAMAIAAHGSHSTTGSHSAHGTHGAHGSHSAHSAHSTHSAHGVSSSGGYAASGGNDSAASSPSGARKQSAGRLSPASREGHSDSWKGRQSPGSAGAARMLQTSAGRDRGLQ